MESTILAGQYKIHQSFLPEGMLGAIPDQPFSLDVEKAKQLLAEAGYPDGFSITMDVRNTSPTSDMAQTIQSTFAQAGIRSEEHTYELQSLMRISYAVFCLKKNITTLNK